MKRPGIHQQTDRAVLAATIQADGLKQRMRGLAFGNHAQGQVRVHCYGLDHVMGPLIHLVDGLMHRLVADHGIQFRGGPALGLEYAGEGRFRAADQGIAHVHGQNGDAPLAQHREGPRGIALDFIASQHVNPRLPPATNNWT